MRVGVPSAAGAAPVEREAQIARLADLLDDALDGRGATMLVEGPAGIGKSTLVAAAARAATERRVRVLAARGGQTEQGFSLGVVRQLLEPVVRRTPRAERGALFEGTAALARPLLEGAEQPAAGGAPEPDQLLHGLYWIVAALAERGPMLITVDDAQWADTGSLRFLLFLLRRLPELPVVLLVAVRPSEPGAEAALLAGMTAEPSVEHFELEPLTAAGVAEVVARCLEAEPEEPFAAACLTATGGNPFLLREVLRDLAREGIRPVATEVRAVAGARPGTVVRAVLARLARLPPEAAEVARALAVLERAPFAVVAAVAGLEAEAADPLVDGLVEAGLVTAGHELAFIHPLVREALLGEIPPRERARRHAVAARAVRAAGAGAEVIAGHLLATDTALDAGDVDVLRHAAARALSGGAPGVAVMHLRRATGPAAPEAGFALLVERGRAELLAGRSAEAAATLAQAAAAVPEFRAAAAVARLRGAALLAAGAFEEAEAVLAAAIEDVAGRDRDLELRLEADRAGIAMVGASTAWHPRLDRFLDLPGETAAERFVLAVAVLERMLERAASDLVLDVAARAYAGGQVFREHADEPPGPWWSGIGILGFAERHDEARALVDEQRRLARERGSVVGTIIAALNGATTAMCRGDLRDAEADAEEAYRLALEISWSAWQLAVITRVHAALDRGQVASADEILSRAWPQDGPPPQLARWWVAEDVLCARARLRLEQGAAEDAVAEARRVTAARPARVAPRLFRTGNRYLPAIRGLLALGQAAEAREVAAELVALARCRGYARAIAVADHHLALAEGGPSAPRRLEEAIRVLAGLPAPYEEAEAALDLGALLRRANRPSEARPWLRRALEVADRCGAGGLAARADDELAASGVHRRRRTDAADGLTPSERRVAAMAAEGMSNKQIAQALFVTLKTVETHLANAYRKLGIASRRELVGALAAGP